MLKQKLIYFLSFFSWKYSDFLYFSIFLGKTFHQLENNRSSHYVFQYQKILQEEPEFSVVFITKLFHSIYLTINIEVDGSWLKFLKRKKTKCLEILFVISIIFYGIAVRKSDGATMGIAIYILSHE